MKNSIKTILLALIAGFGGAYLFSLLSILPTKTQSSELFNVKDSGEQTLSFSDWKETPPRHAAEHLDLVHAAAVSTPCVVYIRTQSANNQTTNSWFDYFFGGDNRPVSGSGSGVIYTKDGYIVTNNHVIDGATNIEVIHNKRTYKAIIKGTDPSTDLALLKIEAEGLPSIKIASSENVQVGEWVLAVGNPFNLTSTVTAGIVSAKGRNINALEGKAGQFPLESFIQTDAAINPGNSGGALVNIKGELIGINTTILSRTGSYTGYAFAVPSDIVVKVVTDLKQYGQVQKAFLGADVIEVNEEVYKELKLDEISGVIITYLEPQGAAETAGLLRGDVLLKINGKAVVSKNNFEEMLSYFKPGDKINVQYKRGGKLYDKEILLRNAEGTTSVIKRQVFKAENIGADLEIVPKSEKSRLGIDNGVRVTKINKGLIKSMGLEEGFIFIAVNDIPIESPEKLSEILERIRGRVVIKGVSPRGEKGFYSYYF